MTQPLQRHRISAGAIVEHEGRLLMVRHVVPGKYDFWVAPGGGVKGSESYEEAAAREVWEETGLTVRVGALLYIEDLVCRAARWWLPQYVAPRSCCRAHHGSRLASSLRTSSKGGFPPCVESGVCQ